MARNQENKGVIQKIQRQTGCLLLVVGIAMLAFVLTDLINSRTGILGGSEEVDNSIGEIDGEKIDQMEFDQLYQNLMQVLMQQNPEMAQMEGMRKAYRDQAWNQLVQQKVFEPQYTKVGVQVTAEEMKDITFGDHPHSQIRQAFADQTTGEFNKAQLLDFLQNQMPNNPQAKAQWVQFESSLKDQIISQKYSNLIKHSVFVNKLEVKETVEKEQKNVNANIVAIQFNTMSDSAYNPTDNQLEKYLAKNKEDFKLTESRSLEYISFSILPTAKDTQATKEWAESIKPRFAKAKDDSSFLANMNPVTNYTGMFEARGSFDESIESQIFDADSGKIIGPVLVSGRYALYKILAYGEDSLYSVRGRHVFIQPKGRLDSDTTEAMAKARQTMADIKNGNTTFEAEAAKNIDGTGARNGELGWLKEGNTYRDEELLNGMLSHSEGDMFIVKTKSGVHIVEVTHGKSKKTVQVAVVDRMVEPGGETDKAIYGEASNLVSYVQEVGFEAAVDSLGLTIRKAEEILENNPSIPGMKDPKEIIRWAFKSSINEGDVSDIMSVDGKYIVARVANKKVSGYAKVDDVREELTKLVKREMAAEETMKKMNDATANNSDLEGIAKALGTEVRNVMAQNYNDNNVSFIGVEPKVLGAMFGLEQNKISQPIPGETGVYIVEVTGYSNFDSADPGVETQKKNELTDQRNSMVENRIIEALKSGANVKDYRYRFY